MPDRAGQTYRADRPWVACGVWPTPGLQVQKYGIELRDEGKPLTEVTVESRLVLLPEKTMLTWADGLHGGAVADEALPPAVGEGEDGDRSFRHYTHLEGHPASLVASHNFIRTATAAGGTYWDITACQFGIHSAAENGYPLVAWSESADPSEAPMRFASQHNPFRPWGLLAR